MQEAEQEAKAALQHAIQLEAALQAADKKHSKARPLTSPNLSCRFLLALQIGVVMHMLGWRSFP